MADPARERGTGREITLVDGSKVNIVFTFWTLAYIEDEYGSVNAIDDIFAGGTEGKIVGPLFDIVVTAIDDPQGREWTSESLLKAVPLTDFNGTIHTIKDALTEGFQKSRGNQAPEPKAKAASKSKTTLSNRSGSRGTSSSTSGASTSNKNAPTSGA